MLRTVLYWQLLVRVCYVTCAAQVYEEQQVGVTLYGMRNATAQAQSYNNNAVNVTYHDLRNVSQHVYAEQSVGVTLFGVRNMTAQGSEHAHAQSYNENAVNVTFYELRNVTDSEAHAHNSLVSFYDLRDGNRKASKANQTNQRPSSPLRFPCSCQQRTCGCCVGMNIYGISLNNHRACMNFTYDPSDTGLAFKILMDEKVVYQNRVQGRNPPPICLPLPVPFLPWILFHFCTKIFDVYTKARNIHFCVEFEARLRKRPILKVHFECLRMGVNGVAIFKPGNPGNLPSGQNEGVSGGGVAGGGGGGIAGGEIDESVDVEDVDETGEEEIYDEILEEKKKNTTMNKKPTRAKHCLTC